MTDMPESKDVYIPPKKRNGPVQIGLPSLEEAAKFMRRERAKLKRAEMGGRLSRKPYKRRYMTMETFPWDSFTEEDNAAFLKVLNAELERIKPFHPEYFVANGECPPLDEEDQRILNERAARLLPR